MTLLYPNPCYKERPRQTVRTQIRLLQTDLGLHCLPFRLSIIKLIKTKKQIDKSILCNVSFRFFSVES